MLFVALGLLFATTVLGQSADCKQIYDYAEVMPSYRHDTPRYLLDYVSKEVRPILYRNMQREGSLIASLYFTLLIDQSGRVSEVRITRPRLSPRCEREVQQKLLTMTGWTPARRQGKAVCCRVKVPISCLKWQ